MRVDLSYSIQILEQKNAALRATISADTRTLDRQTTMEEFLRMMHEDLTLDPSHQEVLDLLIDGLRVAGTL